MIFSEFIEVISELANIKWELKKNIRIMEQGNI